MIFAKYFMGANIEQEMETAARQREIRNECTPKSPETQLF
jgi:hypothetical protein